MYAAGGALACRHPVTVAGARCAAARRRRLAPGGTAGVGGITRRWFDVRGWAGVSVLPAAARGQRFPVVVRLGPVRIRTGLRLGSLILDLTGSGCTGLLGRVALSGRQDGFGLPAGFWWVCCLRTR